MYALFSYEKFYNKNILQKHYLRQQGAPFLYAIYPTGELYQPAHSSVRKGGVDGIDTLHSLKLLHCLYLQTYGVPNLIAELGA